MAAGRRSATVPANFTVRHNLPPGSTVSLKGLEDMVVKFFGPALWRRAGVEVFDERKFWDEFGEKRTAGPE
jgi:hypothetical protein